MSMLKVCFVFHLPPQSENCKHAEQRGLTLGHETAVVERRRTDDVDQAPENDVDARPFSEEMAEPKERKFLGKSELALCQNRLSFTPASIEEMCLAQKLQSKHHRPQACLDALLLPKAFDHLTQETFSHAKDAPLICIRKTTCTALHLKTRNRDSLSCCPHIPRKTSVASES